MGPLSGPQKQQTVETPFARSYVEDRVLGSAHSVQRQPRQGPLGERGLPPLRTLPSRAAQQMGPRTLGT